MNEHVTRQIQTAITSNKVVLFMKGTRQSPMCGFSAKTVAALDSVAPDYVTVNVLDDPEIREGIKVYGNWPTIPQLYIDGELMGGCDIVLNMLNSGELHQTLGLEAPDRTPPEITVTPAFSQTAKPLSAARSPASSPSNTRIPSSTYRFSTCTCWSVSAVPNGATLVFTPAR